MRILTKPLGSVPCTCKAVITTTTTRKPFTPISPPPPRPVKPVPSRPSRPSTGTTSGFSFTGMGTTTGSFPSGATGTGTSAGGTGFILNCELLPRAQCHGRTMGTNRFCMWHVRDGRCHDGRPTSPEDFCAQMGDMQSCNNRAGMGRNAPGQGCCWDPEGYCDGFDAGDCGLPAAVGVGGMGAGGMGAGGMGGVGTNSITGYSLAPQTHTITGSGFNTITGVGGHSEFEHPEIEAAEIAEMREEIAEMEGLHPGFMNQWTGKRTGGEAATAEATGGEPAAPALKEAHKQHKEGKHSYKVLVVVTLIGVLFGLVSALAVQNFCWKRQLTIHQVPLTENFKV